MHIQLCNNRKNNNKANQARKSMSSKFEPSPFGKFFGSKKRNSNPIDMSEFKSWKSKNYRGAEESLDKPVLIVVLLTLAPLKYAASIAILAKLTVTTR